MPALLWSIASWFVRDVLVKFIVLAAVYALLTMFLPIIFQWIAPYIKVGNLTSAFSSVPSGVWWLLDILRLDIGVPALISAWVVRFYIRRVPMVG